MTKIADASPANLVAAPGVDPAARSGTSGAAAPAQAWSGSAGTGIGLGPIPVAESERRCAHCGVPATFAPWSETDVGIFLCNDHQRAILPIAGSNFAIDPDHPRKNTYDIGRTNIPCLSCGRHGDWQPEPPLGGWVHSCIADTIRRRVLPIRDDRSRDFRIAAFGGSAPFVDVNYDHPTLAVVDPDGTLWEPRRCVICVHNQARREVLLPGVYLCEACVSATDPHDWEWANSNRPACGLCSGGDGPRLGKGGPPRSYNGGWFGLHDGQLVAGRLWFPEDDERHADGVVHCCVWNAVQFAVWLSRSKPHKAGY
jgi:hypothetical protein